MGKKKIFTSDAWENFIAGIAALKDKIDGKADEHTHPYLSSNTKYAGASTAGGSATSAVKLDTATAGSATQPVYFTGGKPSACTYSLNKTVPSDAKFTDTTYSAATTSAAGLMSAADKSKSDVTNIAYGTCSTAAATAAKVVTISGNSNWKLAAGSIITVLFNATNTAENPTLNVNSTGAKNIFYSSTQITTSSLGYAGTANRPMTFMYDGTQYRFIGWGYDSNTTYTNVKLGHGYVTCSTAAATTAKVASLSSYTLTTGGIVAVKFTNGNTVSNPTLNINSKGAKAIYYNGAALTDTGLIQAGDIVTMIYSSYYHIISIDKAGVMKTAMTATSTLSHSGTFTAITGLAIDGYNITPTTTTYTLPADNNTVYTHPTYTTRTGKPTADQTPAFGGTVTVSQITSDGTGHVTAATDRTITIPSTLSNGAGTAGLIKTTSTVTSNSGYTACPVISGVPYYKDTNTDTNTTYTFATGDSNGQIKVTPSDGTAQNVSVKGLGSAAYKAVTDSTSASAISTGTSLVTERDVYYGLPKINNSKSYTSSTTIYAPTAGGTSGYVLVGAGATAAPTWQSLGDAGIMDLTSAQNASGIKTFIDGIEIGDEGVQLTYDSTEGALRITFLSETTETTE